MWMGPEGYPVDGSPGYILDAEKLPFDDSLFVAGDMICGITKAPLHRRPRRHLRRLEVGRRHVDAGTGTRTCHRFRV